MMQENYLKYLKSRCKEFAKGKEMFDILLYGSSVKGKIEARDIDLLLVFNDKSLKERMEISQNLKSFLKEKCSLTLNLDIKTINLKELFEHGFLARQNLLIESLSLVDNIPFSEKLGFEGYSLFSYTLKNLNHNEKTKFTYSLIGRKNEGMLKKLEAKTLGKGAVLIPIKNSLIFENFLDKWRVSYNKKGVLISQ